MPSPPAWQGRGLATAAVRELLREAFAAPDVERVTARTLAEPGPSVRVLEKSGFATSDGDVADREVGTAWRLPPASARWQTPPTPSSSPTTISSPSARTVTGSPGVAPGARERRRGLVHLGVGGRGVEGVVVDRHGRPGTEEMRGRGGLARDPWPPAAGSPAGGAGRSATGPFTGRKATSIGPRRPAISHHEP